ncbi:MAG: hypothetical protein ABI746_13175 [Dermatophilaceae bacterium]
MLSLLAGAVWQVLVASLLLGAALPAIFALGVRAMAYGAGGGAEVPPAPARPMGRVLGFLCFAAVLLAVAAGISVIAASAFGMTVSFEHIVPTFAPKVR